MNNQINQIREIFQNDALFDILMRKYESSIIDMNLDFSETILAALRDYKTKPSLSEKKMLTKRKKYAFDKFVTSLTDTNFNLNNNTHIDHFFKEPLPQLLKEKKISSDNYLKLIKSKDWINDTNAKLLKCPFLNSLSKQIQKGFLIRDIGAEINNFSARNIDLTDFISLFQPFGSPIFAGVKTKCNVIQDTSTANALFHYTSSLNNGYEIEVSFKASKKSLPYFEKGNIKPINTTDFKLLNFLIDISSKSSLLTNGKVFTTLTELASRFTPKPSKQTYLSVLESLTKLDSFYATKTGFDENGQGIYKSFKILSMDMTGNSIQIYFDRKYLEEILLPSIVFTEKIKTKNNTTHLLVAPLQELRLRHSNTASDSAKLTLAYTDFNKYTKISSNKSREKKAILDSLIEIKNSGKIIKNIIPSKKSVFIEFIPFDQFCFEDYNLFVKEIGARGILPVNFPPNSFHTNLEKILNPKTLHYNKKL